MNYLSHHRKKKYSVILLIIVVLTSVFLKPQMPNWVTKSTHYIASPFWTTKNNITDSVSIKSKKTLLEENRGLQEELRRSQINKISNDLLREENASLKEELGRSIYENTIVASILVRPNRTLYDTFIIDIGKNNNVKDGDYVIAHGDVVVGYIESTFSNTSLVKLFSSPGEMIDVIIGENEISAVAEGIGGGNFKMSLPRGVEVNKLDAIITPTIESQILALVEEIIVNPTDSFKTILFKGPVNLSELRFVQVLHSYDE